MQHRKYEKVLRYMEDIVILNIYIRVLEHGNRKNREESLFKEIILKNFPELKT